MFILFLPAVKNLSYFNYSNLEAVIHVTGFKVEQTNYPIWIRKFDSPEIFLNRLFRKLLSVFKSDQEILLVARKISKLFF